MSLVKYLTNQYDESLTHCAQALKINPNNIKAIFRQANILYDRDLYDECQQVKMNILFVIMKEY
jgi:hypothetical protein